MGRRAAAAVAGSAARTRDGAAAAAGAVGGGRVGAGRGAESPRLAGVQSNWGGWTARTVSIGLVAAAAEDGTHKVT